MVATGLPQHWQTGDHGLTELSVPDGQEAVSQAKNATDVRLVRLVEQVWFTAFSINVSVGTEERCEGSNLVPPNEHLRFRVAEETTNVSCEGIAMNTRSMTSRRRILTSGEAHARDTI